jgi:hypothetical protein
VFWRAAAQRTAAIMVFGIRPQIESFEMIARSFWKTRDEEMNQAGSSYRAAGFPAARHVAAQAKRKLYGEPHAPRGARRHDTVRQDMRHLHE